MVEPLSDGQLESIKARHNKSVPYTGGKERIADAWMQLADRDRGQLLYEVERLQAELERAIEVYDHNPVNDAMGNMEAFATMLKEYNQKV